MSAPLSLTAPSLAASTSSMAPPVDGEVSPNCCASAWYPWTWHFTEEDCNATGDQVEEDIAVVIDHDCFYEDNPPASTEGRHWHLYVLEITGQ
jgi:hypothetical protein